MGDCVYVVLWHHHNTATGKGETGISPGFESREEAVKWVNGDIERRIERERALSLYNNERLGLWEVAWEGATRTYSIQRLSAEGTGGSRRGGWRRYDVDIAFSPRICVPVYARSEEEAEEIVSDLIDGRRLACTDSQKREILDNLLENVETVEAAESEPDGEPED